MVSPIVGFNVLSDSDDPDILLTQTPGGTLLAHRPADARSAIRRSAGAQLRRRAGIRNEVSFRMGRAAGEIAIRKVDHLLRQQRYLPIQRSGTELGIHQPRSDQGRSGEVEAVRRSRSSPITARRRLTVSSPAWRNRPSKRGMIWAGTDDGNVQVTLNGGGQWTNVAANISGVPPNSPVSCRRTVTS